jgi:membrane protein
MFAKIRASLAQFAQVDGMTLAAALSYYTLFALPPLLFLLASTLSTGMLLIVERDTADARARTYLQNQVGELIGSEAASREIGKILERTKLDSGKWWKAGLSVLGLLIGATGLVQSLQRSLNHIWGVEATGGVFSLQFLRKRLFSFGMILAFGLLLLISFVVSTVLHFLGNWLADQFRIVDSLSTTINQVVSFVVSWVFFATLFRVMPDAVVRWKEAVLGGVFTVVLFTLGRLGLHYYLRIANPGEHLGSAAAALMVIIVWVYYSYAILLLGAAFTKQLIDGEVIPDQGAVLVDSPRG